MKSYDELQAAMEAIQLQMVETKKNERTNAPTHSKKWSVCAESLGLPLDA